MDFPCTPPDPPPPRHPESRALSEPPVPQPRRHRVCVNTPVPEFKCRLCLHAQNQMNCASFRQNALTCCNSAASDRRPLEARRQEQHTQRYVDSWGFEWSYEKKNLHKAFCIFRGRARASNDVTRVIRWSKTTNLKMKIKNSLKYEVEKKSRPLSLH